MPSFSNDHKVADKDRYHHGDLRRALVAAALELLTEGQGREFSLREVARRAKVSHNAPYNHFADKQALLAALAAAGFDLLRARMEEAASICATPQAALAAIGVAYVQFGVGNPALFRLMFGATIPKAAGGSSSSLAQQAAASAKDVLIRTIRLGAADGGFRISRENEREVDTAVLTAWSLVHGLTVLLTDGVEGVAPTSEEDVEHITNQVTRMLLTGLNSPDVSG